MLGISIVSLSCKKIFMLENIVKENKRKIYSDVFNI